MAMVECSSMSQTIFGFTLGVNGSVAPLGLGPRLLFGRAPRLYDFLNGVPAFVLPCR